MKKTVSFSKNARNIFFHLLTDCNLKCGHCYINKDIHGKNPVPPETAKIWLNSFFKKNKENNLILLGGEPTLYPKLAEIVKTAKSLGYKSVTIDTNGWMFNDILTKVTPEQVDWFSFSLDGPAEQINDKIRGKGSFQKISEGIKKAVKLGFNASAIYTVSQFNIDYLKHMPLLLKQLGVKTFFIQVIGRRGKSAADPRFNPADRDSWLKQVPAAAKNASQLGITAIYPKVYLRNNEPFECAGLLAENFFIFPNGRVYTCPLCEDYPLHSLTVNPKGELKQTPRINEKDLFNLNIPEGCVINKLVQPGNIEYSDSGIPQYKIACCMLKETMEV